MCAHQKCGWVQEWRGKSIGKKKTIYYKGGVSDLECSWTTNSWEPGLFWEQITEELPVLALSLSSELLAGAGNPD